MISFESDYIEGAHEEILKRLTETNMEQLSGYGADKYCESAKAKIKAACKCPEADVWFITGGTQTATRPTTPSRTRIPSVPSWMN